MSQLPLRVWRRMTTPQAEHSIVEDALAQGRRRPKIIQRQITWNLL